MASTGVLHAPIYELAGSVVGNASAEFDTDDTWARSHDMKQFIELIDPRDVDFETVQAWVGEVL